ncbi:60S ribosome subunit biogenesis protein NOP8 [Nakaseomyces bracarensis]|uniref:60S ribosome subunit biogenesis protein NOP8 n=1 Tax=Nakaseomyces bracarensis TaxID=273131 RepID=A0ABR4NWM7_9SACH
MLEQRLFIGNLKHDRDGCLQELEKRFAKYGELLNSKSETDDVFDRRVDFAFVTMNFENSDQLARLRSGFNKVKFKGNELVVDLAKPSWSDSWEERMRVEKKESKALKRKHDKNDWEYYKKMENIAKRTWEDLHQVIPGRMREAPRKKAALRNITFRINVNGTLKVYKCYKTKLWGYERNKDNRDLVSKFTNHRFWKDGADHVVERLDYSRSRGSLVVSGSGEGWNQYLEDIYRRKQIRLGLITDNSDTVARTENITKLDGLVDDSESELEHEKEKTHDVLSQVLSNFDFEKPVAFDDEDDFPIERDSGSYATDEVQYYEKENDESGAAGAENYEQNQWIEQTEEEEKPVEKEDDFIPTFGKPEEKTVVEGTISNTDTLRSLFNPETGDSQDYSSTNVESTSDFKLINDMDNDIDHNKDPLFTFDNLDVVKDDTEHVAQLPKLHSAQHHLFFPHFDSPFLQGQTQLSKIQMSQQEYDLDKWDTEFWENRGNWMREMKQKRRDALRKQRRKNGKHGNALLV